jgi:hypothetical protein
MPVTMRRESIVYCVREVVIQNHTQDSEKAISLPLISNKFISDTMKNERERRRANPLM